MLSILCLVIDVPIDVISKETNTLHIWEECHSVWQMSGFYWRKEIARSTKITFCERTEYILFQSDSIVIVAILSHMISTSAQEVAIIREDKAWHYDAVGLKEDIFCSFGTPEQIQKCVDAYMETGWPLCSLSISEPGAGSDNRSMTCTAKKQEDGTYVLNGQKTWVTMGAQLPYTIVVAKDEDPARENGSMSLWLINMDRAQDPRPWPPRSCTEAGRPWSPRSSGR